MSEVAFGRWLHVIQHKHRRKLFDTFVDDPDEFFWKMVMMLRKMPEPGWSTTWEARKTISADSVDAQGRVVDVRLESLDSGTANVHIATNGTVIQPPGPRSVQDALSRGLSYEN